MPPRNADGRALTRVAVRVEGRPSRSAAAKGTIRIAAAVSENGLDRTLPHRRRSQARRATCGPCATAVPESGVPTYRLSLSLMLSESWFLKRSDASVPTDMRASLDFPSVRWAARESLTVTTSLPALR
jgi:hypothetical protein